MTPNAWQLWRFSFQMERLDFINHVSIQACDWLTWGMRLSTCVLYPDWLSMRQSRSILKNDSQEWDSSIFKISMSNKIETIKKFEVSIKIILLCKLEPWQRKRKKEKLDIFVSTAVADSGFALGSANLRADANSRYAYVSKNLCVETKESGLFGGSGRRLYCPLQISLYCIEWVLYEIKRVVIDYWCLYCK